jgi:enoyl-CoA hydratase/carnithine racemase
MISIMVSMSTKGHNSGSEEESIRVEGQTYKAVTCQDIGFCRVVDVTPGLDEEAIEPRFAELAELCGRIAWDEQARVVVLCFDGELSIPNGVVEQSSLVEPVARLKQPVIAAIRGNATDLGLELALACDIRVCTEDARFGFPLIRMGRIPSNGGTQRLPRLIGQAKAMEMILTGELVDAREAGRMGLINRVVPSGTLMSSVMELAHDMSAKSPLSLSYAKEALYSGRDLTLDQGLRMELDLYLLLFTTSDRTEGITAFKEKRKPKFEGI